MFKTINSAIRRETLWTLDLARGGVLRKPYNTIKAVMEGDIDAEKYQRHYLKKLISYAKENVPY